MFVMPTKFGENVFFKDLVGKVPFITSKLLADKNYKITSSEKYVTETYSYVNEICHKIKDLWACAVFINCYPKKSELSKLLSRSEYLIYHLDFYYIGIVCIFDRLLKLINYTCELGLADKHVKFDIIINNSKVNNEIKGVLKKFDKSIADIRGLQNGIKHHKKYWDSRLNNADLFETYSSEPVFTRSMSKKDIQTLALSSGLEYASFIKTKTDELKKNNEALVDNLSFVFDKTYPIYKKKLEMLENKND
jgi:hypothetical protein